MPASLTPRPAETLQIIFAVWLSGPGVGQVCDLPFDSTASGFFLHGLVAVHLKRHGWYRVDPRGDKPGVSSGFTPPVECLPYTPKLKGEMDIAERFSDAMACVVAALRLWPAAADVRANLPDYLPGA